MQKILIVDDESIFREYLRTALDWEAYGFEICAEAKNGIEALEQAALHKPDIALVDITMPFMDGLSLTEHLNESYPTTSVVLITGHNEFDYARKALKLGVEDYILKPFSKDELVLTLLKLQKDHQKAQEEKSTLKENQQLIKESFLNHLLSSDYHLSEAETSQRMQQFGESFHSPIFVVACIEIDRMDSKWNQVSERLLWKYAVTNILNEALEETENHLIFNGPEGRIICLVEHQGNDVCEVPELAGYEKLCFLIKKYLKFTITVGVGRSQAGYQGIRTSYLEALEALQHKFVLGNDRVIAYGSGALESGTQALYPTEVNEDLLVQLRMHNGEKVEAKLEEIFQLIREQRLSLDYTYVISMGLISVCLSYVTETGHPIEDCFGEAFFPYSEIKRLESIDVTALWIKKLFSQALQYTGKHRKTRSSKIAQSAKEYIELHYGNSELQLDQIAQQVYINASYLRAVFKKEIGMTVTDYVTHIRMHKAKELLGKGNIRLADIAEQIGLSDPSYFSKSFKKFLVIPQVNTRTIDCKRRTANLRILLESLTYSIIRRRLSFYTQVVKH
ncbi:response regulator [Paenibacillus sp. N3.4]|uniref:response regulator n=1 Tax=Paenibacillus sp. N3.4 TaxID=2603222 RepID=UPI0011C75FA4|nr:response regulator [Paenibacillus sp. N3.4]TXK73511.1 response regulator [Paenibacillus sp. N3.4]